MSFEKPKKDGNIKGQEDDDTDSGESGQGGQSGAVEFRDFIGTGDHSRDDQLSPEEQKRLLIVHNGTQAEHVKKQKILRDQRNDLKSGKISLESYRQSLTSAAMISDFKAPHPVLWDKAQFSGIDSQMNPQPAENVADTNPADRNELEYRYRLQYAPEHAPKFHPKLQPK